MEKPKILYHLTNENELKSIFEEGLIPCIGKNSKRIGEKEPKIYLSNKDSIPFWCILLNKDIVLEINVEGLNVNDEFKYNNYGEYVYTDKIEPSRIKLIKNPKKPTNEHMKTLCISYMGTLSQCVTTCADYYTRPSWIGISEEEVGSMIDSTMSIISGLDYSTVTVDEMRNELIYLGTEVCMTTFVDVYFGTDKRMYEQLKYFEDDSNSTKRKALSEMITTIFDGCLDTETGGYCW